MYLSMYLSIYLSIYLSYLSILLIYLTYLSYLSILPIYLTYLSYLSICLSVYLSVCLSVYLSVCLSVCLSVYLSICIMKCICVCVCPILCLFRIIWDYVSVVSQIIDNPHYILDQQVAKNILQIDLNGTVGFLVGFTTSDSFRFSGNFMWCQICYTMIVNCIKWTCLGNDQWLWLKTKLRHRSCAFARRSPTVLGDMELRPKIQALRAKSGQYMSISLTKRQRKCLICGLV